MSIRRQDVQNVACSSPMQSQPGTKKHKSCQHCRRLKMRCESLDNGSCQRCLKTGKSCVFESFTPRRGSSLMTGGHTRSDEMPNARQNFPELRARPTVPRHSQQHVGQIESSPASMLQQKQYAVDYAAAGSIYAIYKNSDPIATEILQGCSPANLSVPITAVHVMMNPENEGEAQRDMSGWTAENQSRWNRKNRLREADQDLIQKQIITEANARRLFNLYMSFGNIFLPIFDPIVDTFDSIRERSPFTLAVMLAVAARREEPIGSVPSICDMYDEEVQHLAAKTMFENPSSLDNVEAMLVLAVYSEKMWFALGHTYQLAQDLGLAAKLQNFQKVSKLTMIPSRHSEKSRFEVRSIRIWLLIVQYEQFLAIHSLRKPRSERFAMDELSRILHHPLSRISDISICASVELLEIVANLRVAASSKSSEDVREQLNTWIRTWNDQLQACGAHEKSFQAINLRIQKLQLEIIYSGMLFVGALADHQVVEQRAQSSNDGALTARMNIVNLITSLMAIIRDSEVYRQLFAWSPTSETILLAYVVVLGCVTIHDVSMTEVRDEFVKLLTVASELLRLHPHQNFYSLSTRLQSLLGDPSYDSARWKESLDLAAMFYTIDWPVDASEEFFS